MKKFLSDVLIECGLRVDGTTVLGTATATTVATSDNSTNIATTAFVKAQGYITGYTNNYITGLSFNTTNGVLTVTRQGLTDLTVDLDGRYLQSESDTLDTVTARGSVTTNSIGVSTVNIIGSTAGAELLTVDGTYGRLFTVTDDLSDSLFSVNTVAGLPALEVFADNTIKLGSFANPIEIDSSSNIVIPGTITASGYNDSNWNTAYNDRIASVAVSGTTNKTLTLTQGDGGTVTTTWTDNFDNYGSWNLKTNSVQRTTVQSGGDFDLIAGTDISISYAAGGKVTIASTATGSVDYISNVALNGSNLRFTGEGSGFTGDIDLSTLGYLTSYSETDTLATVTARGASTSTAVTFNGGATISGTGGDGSEVLRLTGSASDGFNYSTASVWGNLTAGETVAHVIGKAESQYNTANFGYRHVADGSSSNYVTIGMFQADNLLNVLGNGNVGIGTTSPGYKLDVNGDARVTSNFVAQGDTVTLLNETAGNKNINIRKRFDASSFINWTRSSNTDAYMGVDENENFQIGYASSGLNRSLIFTGDNSEVVRFERSGNVGIGTDSPDGKLEISSNTSVSSYITQYTDDADGAELVIRTARGTESSPVRYNTNDSAGRILFQAYTSSGEFEDAASIESVLESGYANSYAGLRFNYLPAVSPYTLTEGMRLNMNGNVGIGTTAPNRKLHVESSGVIADFKSTTTQGLVDIIGTSNQLRIGTFSGVVGLAYGTGTSPHITIASGGNVGIGTTNPGAKLTLSTPNAYDGTILQLQSRDEPTAYNLKINEVVTGGVVRWSFDMTNNSAYNNVLVFDRGNVGIGTTSPEAKLHVSGGGFDVYTDYSATNSSIGISALKKADGMSALVVGRFHSQNNASVLRFNYVGSNSASNYLGLGFYANDDLLVIKPSGNVGIGTTGPASNLHVVGNVQIEGGSTSVVLETNNKEADPAGALFGEYDIATTYGAIVDYVIYDAGRDNMRSGTFSAVWNAAETRYNDVSTVDIGDTSVVTLTSQINGANVELIVTGDAVYTIKFNTKLIK